MDLLLVSNILLWIGFIAMVVINIALARQIGVLYERVAPAGALMMNQRLKVGDRAPDMAMATIDGKPINIGHRQDATTSQLLFFAAPDCPVCKTLLPVLQSAATAEADWLDVVIGSDGEELDHRGYIKEYDIHQPYVVSELLGKTYGVSKLPYAVLIDEKGRIASMGIVNSREHLESLFEAKERKIASLQEYMQNKTVKTSSAGE